MVNIRIGLSHFNHKTKYTVNTPVQFSILSSSYYYDFLNISNYFPTKDKAHPNACGLACSHTHTQTNTTTFGTAEHIANWDIKQVGFNWQGGNGCNDGISGNISVFVWLNKEVTGLTVSHHSLCLVAVGSEKHLLFLIRPC